MADPCFISFLKPFREIIMVVFLGIGREDVEVVGWEMITLHLGSKETSLSGNYISLRLSHAHLNFYIAWQNERPISFFIQTGVWKYKSMSLWVLFISLEGSQLLCNIF